MDPSRRKDLENLERVINNPKKSKMARQFAYDAKQSILRQLADPKLVALRHRLLKAAQAGNEKEQWKIGCLIKEYLGEELPEQPVLQF